MLERNAVRIVLLEVTCPAIDRSGLSHRRTHLVGDSSPVRLSRDFPPDDPAVAKDDALHAIRLVLLRYVLNDHAVVSVLTLFVVDEDDAIQIFGPILAGEELFTGDLHYVQLKCDNHAAFLCVLVVHAIWFYWG